MQNHMCRLPSLPSYAHLTRLLVAVAALELIRMFTHFIPWKRQGFFCQDDDIRYPNLEDTIRSSTMFVTFFIISIILMATTEYVLIRQLTTRRGRRLFCATTAGNSIHPAVYNSCYIFLTYTCSVLTTSAMISVGKRTASRLRPNFLAVCQPNLAKLCPPNTFRYVEDYVCYGEYKEDEYLSFPSGHSAQALNFAIFFIFYLQKRCKFAEPLRSMLQLLIASYAFFICTSRVRDYKHRLSDVAGGAMVGAGTAIFIIHYVLRHFKLNRYDTTEALCDGAEVDEKRNTRSLLIPSVVVVHDESRKRKQKPDGPTSMTTSEYGSFNDYSSAEEISTVVIT